MTDDIEQAIRIAIWNAAKSHGKSDDVAQTLVARAMVDDSMEKALAALRAAPASDAGLRDKLIALVEDAYREGMNDAAPYAGATQCGTWDSSEAKFALEQALSTPPDTEHRAWLIELGSSEPCDPRYWCGVHGWTRDNLKAVRFVREVDAQSIAEQMSDGAPDEYRLAEHIWDDGGPSPNTEIARLKAQIAELREGLWPFGNPDIIAQLEGDPDDEWAKFRLLVKDYRRAAKALAKIDTEQETG